jgi:beta-lactamase class A
MPSEFLDQVRQISAGAGLTAVGVAFHDYETSLRLSYHGDRWFHAASTFKSVILLALFKAVEEGLVRLDDPLHVRNRFESIVDGSIYRVNGSTDADPEPHRRIGHAMPLLELGRAMITRSSNLATNILIAHLGLPFVRQVVESAGLSGINIRRGVDDLRAFEASLNNEVAANGLVQFFSLLCEGEFLSAASRDQMVEIFLDQKFDGMLPAHLPADAKVAHKTGEISTACHDSGIVYLPGRKPYVFAILTDMPAEVGVAQAAVAEIAGIILSHVTSAFATREKQA